jgi:tetratricopeptide (TPR) repeat protein
MRAFNPGPLALAVAAGLMLASPRPALAQAGSGAPSGASTPGICSGGGCVPRADCQDGASLCSPFPDHPGYDPNVEFRKGAAALKAGDYKVAQKEFGKVLYLAPTNADVLYALGVADVGLGDLAGGAYAFERALKWNPKQIPAARDLAITALKLGQTDKAGLQLAALKTRAAKCGDACHEAADLKDAIAAIETAQARADHS